MTSWEIILVLGGVPLAVLVLLGLLTLRPNFARVPRYRRGQEWDHPPVWLTATPETHQDSLAGHHHPRPGVKYGGARGDW